MSVRYSVELGDVTKVRSDLLILKYAQNFYGADGTVAEILDERGICSAKKIHPQPGWNVRSPISPIPSSESGRYEIRPSEAGKCRGRRHGLDSARAGLAGVRRDPGQAADAVPESSCTKSPWPNSCGYELILEKDAVEVVRVLNGRDWAAWH